MNRTALLAAAVVAVVGVLLFGLYMKRFETEVRGGEPVQVLITTADLPAGQPLTRANLATRELPQQYVEERHIRASDQNRVLGVKLSNPIKSNESLLWSDLATTSQERRNLSELLRPGMRALTVRVGETSAFGGLLRPGDRCDVLLTAMRPGGTEQVTVPLLQNVLVLSVGEDIGGPDSNNQANERRRGRDVNVAVTIEQAALLTLAGEQGTLRLVLRNPEDVTILEGLPDTTATDLIEAQARAVRQNRRPPSTPMIERIQ